MALALFGLLRAPLLLLDLGSLVPLDESNAPVLPTDLLVAALLVAALLVDVLLVDVLLVAPLLVAGHHLPGAEPASETPGTAELRGDNSSQAPGGAQAEEQVAGDEGWHPQSLLHLGRVGMDRYLLQKYIRMGKSTTLALW